jgi:hypothetical protein
MTENKSSALGDYVKSVFDLNKDGHVSIKEFLHTLVPSQAVGIALLVVDALALIGEYRVWQVGMHMSQGDPYKAMGYVAVSLVPFYLSQILWLYPLASGWQQFIAVIMMLVSLGTSVNFGLADLTMQYDTVAISKTVVYLWLAYILMLLMYVLTDKQFKLLRMKINARANTNFQKEMNNTSSQLLADLEQSLEYEQRLRERFGDDAVEAHMKMLHGVRGNSKAGPAPIAPKPLPAPQTQPAGPSNNGSGSNP